MDLGTPRLDTALVHLRSARSIPLLGGGYLNSMWPRNLGLIATAAEYSRAFDIPVYATWLGLLPAEGDNDELRDDLMQFSYAESRDQAGAELFGVHHDRYEDLVREFVARYGHDDGARLAFI